MSALHAKKIKKESLHLRLLNVLVLFKHSSSNVATFVTSRICHQIDLSNIEIFKILMVDRQFVLGLFFQIC